MTLGRPYTTWESFTALPVGRRAAESTFPVRDTRLVSGNLWTGFEDSLYQRLEDSGFLVTSYTDQLDREGRSNTGTILHVFGFEGQRWTPRRHSRRTHLSGSVPAKAVEGPCKSPDLDSFSEAMDSKFRTTRD